MDGFKSLPKMQCFREGGSVKTKPMAKCSGGKMKEGGKADLAQDKAVVKKAFKLHDKQEHKGEKTDLSTLKKGGRAKKSMGTVKKFKSGGSVTNVYEAKKSSGDKDNIRKVKDIAPTKAAAPSKAATKPNFAGSDVAKEKGKPSGEKDLIKKVKPTGNKKAAAPSGAGGPDAFKKGGKVKKYADGRSVVNKLTGPSAAGPAAKAPSAASGQISDYERNRMSNISKLDPAQQAEFAKQQAEATAKFNKKKGGKVKKYAEGGAVMSDEEKNWLGGADATDPFILARMRSALGPKKPQGSYIPNANPTMDNRDVGTTSVKPETSADLDPYGVTRRETSADLDPYGAASKPVAAPVRRPIARRPMVKPETSADLDPYGVTRKETSADLDPYGAASKPAVAPYINIPANNPGMKQFRTDAVSPMETMFNSLFKSRSQRNKKPVA